MASKQIEKQMEAAKRREAEAKSKQARLMLEAELGRAMDAQRSAKAAKDYASVMAHAKDVIAACEALNGGESKAAE